MYLVHDRPYSILDSNYKLLLIPSDYVESLCIHSKRTVLNYAYVLIKWLTFCEQHRWDWRTVTLRQLSDYLESANVSNSTLNYHLRRLVDFYDYARRRGVLNPVFANSKVRQLKKRVSHQPVSLPVLSDFARFLAALPEPYRQMAELMGVCGLRRSEVLSLRRTDLRGPVTDGVLHCKLIGKGRVARTVGIPMQLVEKLKARCDACGLIFAHHGKPYTGAAVSHAFRKCSCSLELEIHPHLMRHLFATLRLMELGRSGIHQDVALRILQHELGHSQASTTQIYVDVAMMTGRPQVGCKSLDDMIRRFSKEGV